MSILDLQNHPLLTKEDIIKQYFSPFKNKDRFKIGLEYERLLINKKNCKAVPYYGEEGIYRLLRQIALKHEWKYMTDFGQVIGIVKGQNTMTLEPGGQFEISLEPQNTIKDIEKKLDKYDKKILPIAKNLDIEFLNYGISPLSTYETINLIPKKRYSIMAKNLPGDHLANMMRETAGIQTCFDYFNEDDAAKKLRLSLMLSPIMTAMFANSPIYNGKLSGYKSYRALSWLFTDNNRCGLISKKLFTHCDFRFSDYVNVLLDLPMLFIVRNNTIIELNQKITFNQFLQKGYNNYNPQFNDFSLHASLFFPEVRLKKYLEIRNHDCQKGVLKYAIPAVYKGIFYNETSMNQVYQLFKTFKYEDFAFARENVPKHALEAQLGRYKLHDMGKELLKISEFFLKKEGKNEQKYLEPIQELVNDKMSPADLIIKNWYSKWNGQFDKFIKYVIET